jgi:hypothetical protein
MIITALEFNVLSFPMDKNEQKSSITINYYPAEEQNLQTVGTYTQLEFAEKMFPAKFNR